MAGILTVAAETGNIDGLYASIKVDPKVLDDIDAIPFVDTPLHIAASAGHTDFALEILRLKPSFGGKINPDGLSSLHLALINDKFETVKRLIKFDEELIRVKGREGANLLHLIAKIANDPSDTDEPPIVVWAEDCIDMLAEFLFACPDSIEDLTIRDETALHISVKTENQRAAQVILGFIRKTGRKRVLDYKDEKGNTALDMAESTSQHMIVNSIRKASSGRLLQIARSLLYLRDSKRLKPDHSPAEFLISLEQPWEVSSNLIERASKEQKNTGLVVAVLVATATFTAVLSPPGGLGGPGDNNLLTNGSNINATVSSTTNNLFAANTSFINATLFIPTDDPIERFLFKDAGVTYGHVFNRFYYLNTCAFVLAMLAIMIYLPFRGFIVLHCALVSLMISYGISFYLISPSYGYAQNLETGSIWCALLVYLFRSVRLLVFSDYYSKGVTPLATPLTKRRRILLNRLMRNNVGK